MSDAKSGALPPPPPSGATLAVPSPAAAAAVLPSSPSTFRKPIQTTITIPDAEPVSSEQFFRDVWPLIDVRDPVTKSYLNAASASGFVLRDAFADKLKGVRDTAHRQAEFVMTTLRRECERSGSYRELMTRIKQKYDTATAAHAEAKAAAAAGANPLSGVNAPVAVVSLPPAPIPVTLWLSKNSAAFIDHENEWTFDADDLKTFPIDPYGPGGENDSAAPNSAPAATTGGGDAKSAPASAATTAANGSDAKSTTAAAALDSVSSPRSPVACVNCCHVTRGELLMHVLEERYYMGAPGVNYQISHLACLTHRSFQNRFRRDLGLKSDLVSFEISELRLQPRVTPAPALDPELARLREMDVKYYRSTGQHDKAAAVLAAAESPAAGTGTTAAASPEPSASRTPTPPTSPPIAPTSTTPSASPTPNGGVPAAPVAPSALPVPPALHLPVASNAIVKTTPLAPSSTRDGDAKSAAASGGTTPGFGESESDVEVRARALSAMFEAANSARPPVWEERSVTANYLRQAAAGLNPTARGQRIKLPQRTRDAATTAIAAGTPTPTTATATASDTDSATPLPSIITPMSNAGGAAAASVLSGAMTPIGSAASTPASSTPSTPLSDRAAAGSNVGAAIKEAVAKTAPRSIKGEFLCLDSLGGVLHVNGIELLKVHYPVDYADYDPTGLADVCTYTPPAHSNAFRDRADSIINKHISDSLTPAQLSTMKIETFGLRLVLHWMHHRYRPDGSAVEETMKYRLFGSILFGKAKLKVWTQLNSRFLMCKSHLFPQLLDVSKLLEWGESEVRKTLDATGTTIAYVEDWRSRIVPLEPITARITALKSKLQVTMKQAFDRHGATIQVADTAADKQIDSLLHKLSTYF